MLNSECIAIFEKYLRKEKKASDNTLSSYLRDIRQFGEYLDKHTDVVVSGYGLFVYLFESLRDGRATIDLRADTICYDEVRNPRYG